MTGTKKYESFGKNGVVPPLVNLATISGIWHPSSDGTAGTNWTRASREVIVF